jgi:hypothetical protein
MINNALVSCFGPLSHKYSCIPHKRQLELLHQVLAGHEHIAESYASWDEAFPQNEVDYIDIGNVEKSPLFIVLVKLHDLADDPDMIEKTRACPAVKTKHHGFSSDDSVERAFLNDCWNATLSKSLSLRRKPVPVSV